VPANYSSTNQMVRAGRDAGPYRFPLATCFGDHSRILAVTIGYTAINYRATVTKLLWGLVEHERFLF
jgi:hypothetical protein